MDDQPIRVLCVDDNEAVVEALAEKLALEPGIVCVGRLYSADALIEQVRRAGAAAPHVVLLDIEMPGRDAIDALGELSRTFPGVRTVILSAYVRDDYIAAAVRAGAWGYLSKGDSPAEITAAIRQVARGEFAFGREAGQRFARLSAEGNSGGAPFSGPVSSTKPTDLDRRGA
jgi:DNA-binding NarL/FixJ family response regulator